MQLVMPFAPATSYDPADFIPAAANQQAFDWVVSWPDWPYSVATLSGPSGSGKTHLAHVFARRSGAQFIAPARIGGELAEQILTGHHSWILDGIEAVRDEAALAQLLNHARARGDYLLLIAQQPAATLPVTRADLASRLRALPALVIAPPDDGLLRAMLAKAFADRQIRVAPEVLDFAITHLERHYPALQQFVVRMDRLALARGRAISVPLVREALSQS